MNISKDLELFGVHYNGKRDQLTSLNADVYNMQSLPNETLLFLRKNGTGWLFEMHA